MSSGLSKTLSPRFTLGSSRGSPYPGREKDGNSSSGEAKALAHNSQSSGYMPQKQEGSPAQLTLSMTMYFLHSPGFQGFVFA